jgi:hypothetical protein
MMPSRSEWNRCWQLRSFHFNRTANYRSTLQNAPRNPAYLNGPAQSASTTSVPQCNRPDSSARDTLRDSATRPGPVSPSPSLGATTTDFAQVTEILAKIGISKRRFKQVESICLIRDQRANRQQDLAFNARPFVLCGLPLRRPPSTQLVHRRRNGNFFLHIVAHPDYGLLELMENLASDPSLIGRDFTFSTMRTSGLISPSIHASASFDANFPLGSAAS